MSYCYEAVDAEGLKIQGILEVTTQGEALRRIKEMGLFPTRVSERSRRRVIARQQQFRSRSFSQRFSIRLFSGRVKARALTVFTRQLATLIEAGMPLLRGLRTLRQQETNSNLNAIIGEVAETIEGGSSLSEALSKYPKTFNGLYLNMVRAGELGGALELTLRRLAEFMEKSQKIKGRVKSALFYPAAVVTVALTILTVMMVFVVPRFQQVFDGLMDGRPMPAFTMFVLGFSTVVKNNIGLTLLVIAAAGIGLLLGLRTDVGRLVLDRLKLTMPLLGPVFLKAAISRFTRTLGTLLSSGVPVLQALTIVKETAGNLVVANVISSVHDSVKQGETIAVPLKSSRVFPPMVIGMVDVGEQTGALPEMLMKVADNYDDEVDNAVGAMTSLLEPILIVFLAVVVGSIVIAMFLPLLRIIDGGFDHPGGGGD